jgi:hypothetical protein
LDEEVNLRGAVWRTERPGAANPWVADTGVVRRGEGIPWVDPEKLVPDFTASFHRTHAEALAAVCKRLKEAAA